HAIHLRFEQSFSCRSPYSSIWPGRLRVRWILVCYFRANHCSLSRMSTSECLHNLLRQCSEYRSRDDYRYYIATLPTPCPLVLNQQLSASCGSPSVGRVPKKL